PPTRSSSSSSPRSVMAPRSSRMRAKGRPRATDRKSAASTSSGGTTPAAMRRRPRSIDTAGRYQNGGPPRAPRQPAAPAAPPAGPRARSDHADESQAHDLPRDVVDPPLHERSAREAASRAAPGAEGPVGRLGAGVAEARLGALVLDGGRPARPARGGRGQGDP